MKTRLYLLSFGLALAVAAAGQTGNQSQTQTSPVNSTTPATQIGSGAQTKAGTPAQSSTTTTPAGQVNPTGTAEPPAAQGTAPATGGVAGAAGASAAQTPAANNSASGVAAVSDSDLEGQIQNALNKEPTLSGDSTHVKVAGDTIELGGNVGTNKEKITATRIVQSYAGSKKLVNNLTISGRTGNTTVPRTDQDQTDRSGVSSSTTDRTGNNPNPATNPEPQKGSKPPHN